MWASFNPGKYSLRLLTVLLLPVMGLIFLFLQSGGASAEQFVPPNLDGFKLRHERKMDGDGDKITETNVKKYLNQSGDSIVSMTTRGQQILDHEVSRTRNTR